jgi:murein DD-endopeptidase MepM/ murein hydrolase activator NlpD
MESSFRNVFGHDTVRNPIKSPGGGTLAVTEKRYRTYLRHRRLGEGAQGVGPMQLTHPSLQDEADALGGCFRPAVNIHVGVRHLATLIADHGLKAGVQHYNGAKGDDYSTEVLRRRHTWAGRLRGAHEATHGTAQGPAHQPAGNGAAEHAPGHAAPRTFKLMRTPMRGADVRRLQRDLNERFATWAIGRRIAEDGRYGAQTQLAAHQVAIALGIATAAYEHGITPRLRGLIRTPSRRTPSELRRAKARRGYRAKLRKRYGRAGVTAIHVGGLVYPLPVHGRDLGGVAAHKARPFGNWQSDNAVDIGVPRGTAVLAVADGTITRLGGAWHGGSGNPDGFNVTLDAGARRWFYTHLMERVDLSVGQRLSAGQLLGRSGAGNGVDHLHIASSAGDPERLLRVNR